MSEGYLEKLHSSSLFVLSEESVGAFPLAAFETQHEA